MTQNLAMETTETGQFADRAPQAGEGEPGTPSEKYLASLWTEIIGLDRVTLPDKFLDLGGNSLTLNIILSRIENEKGVSIPPQLFFDPERSSLFELAREMDALPEGGPDRPRQTAPAVGCAQ
jgi:acyl carrier protein